MSDTPCLESDLHPHPGDIPMRFKVEYEVEMTSDEAKELAEGEGTEEEFADDQEGQTENNIQGQVEDSCEFEWEVQKVKVNHIP